MALLLSLVLVALGQAQAQHSATTGSIVGTVVDASTHEALPNVQVLIKGTTIGTTTDVHGAFSIQGLAPGSYTIQARLVGYGVEESRVGIEAGHSRPFEPVDTHLVEATVLTVILDAKPWLEAEALTEVLRIGPLAGDLQEDQFGEPQPRPALPARSSYRGQLSELWLQPSAYQRS